MAKHAKRYTNHSKKDLKKITKLQTILLIIFVSIFLVSGYILLNWYINTGKSDKKYEQLEKQVIQEEGKNENKIDFTKLENINSDVVAWIKIDETAINYPVVKTTDNSYYLSKNFYKENDVCGSIFLDYRSNVTDKNIVIYGHHIKRGTMFSDLEKIANGDIGNNIKIILYTKNKTMQFNIFSSYFIDPEDYAIDTTIDENKLDDFKETVKKRSEVKFDSECINSNQVLTLSTCDKTGKKRVLVHAGLEEISYNKQEK